LGDVVAVRVHGADCRRGCGPGRERGRGGGAGEDDEWGEGKIYEHYEHSRLPNYLLYLYNETMFWRLFYRFCRYEWDEAKSIANVAKHGFDFDLAIAVSKDKNRIEQIDKKRDYCETRYNVIGTAYGRRIFVVYTRRLWKKRIISARFIHGREWGKYYG
jgi:uncharacterized DUF497 family protein